MNNKSSASKLRLKKTILFLIGLSLSINANTQNSFCGLKNSAFQEGEHLYYKAYYNMGRIWVGAGDAHFNTYSELFNNRKCYHVVGIGKTFSSYEWFYKVLDRYESYIDPETLTPLKFIRNVSEGGTKFTNNVSFNQSTGKAFSSNTTFTIPQCTQDVLSAIYYARNIDYNSHKIGDKIPFTMFLDNQVYNLYIRYMGKEKLKTRYGTFNTIKIVPLLIKGTLFEGGEKMEVWVSDDSNHIPVRVSSPIIIGSLKADLMGFDHLRNPLSSLISTK